MNAYIYEQLKKHGNTSIRLIGLDMDGTVFTDDKQITPRTKQAVADAIRSGIAVLPATGRPQMGIPKEFLEIPGVQYCLCSNGAEIYDLQSGECIYQNCLTPEKVLEILPWFLERECTCELYMSNVVYSEHRQSLLWDKVVPNPSIREYVRSTRTLLEDLYAFYQANPMPVNKVNTSFGDHALMREGYRFLDTVSDIVIANGTPDNIEINAGGCDKGEALLALGRLLGIDRDGVMACGDSTNDIAMIVKSGWGVAMENALPEVKDIADIFTLSNNAEGVAELLETVVCFNRELEALSE